MFRFRYTVLVVSLVLAAAASAQQLTVRVPGCELPLWRYRFNGISFVAVEPLAGADGTFTLPNQGKGVSLVYIGADGVNPIPVLLDGQETFTLTGNCQALSAAVITDSKTNDAYQALKRDMAADKELALRLTQQLRLSPANSPAYATAKAELGAHDRKRAALLEQLQTEKQNFFAAAWAADLYTSFENTPKPYSNELDYFGNERFQYADFSDPAFAENPWVYESFREVTKVLTESGLAADAVTDYLKGYLALAANYPAHKLALGGVLATLRAAQNPIAVPFAKEYIARYGSEEIEAANVLQAEIKRLGALSDGGVAPEFSQARLSGEGTAGPADFRGQVSYAQDCRPRRTGPLSVRYFRGCS